MPSPLEAARVQHELPELPSPWRSISALAARLNAADPQHPTLTAHAIRHYVRRADQNGLQPHVRRLGRKLLVNEAGFIDWLENQGVQQ
ncbi:MAG: hypothetical protein VBE63_02170 [Lamprobacter sp.]|uniref:hypothetical protein n=1 Tax=Lamprobacter sp. TaxID=3100796 RepID=UPI002B262FDB|nr:hypothetical protein [Lamprobacter sp.]MEA3638732.1 hypothetical protein [Lamprobacter sp.]